MRGACSMSSANWFICMVDFRTRFFKINEKTKKGFVCTPLCLELAQFNTLYVTHSEDGARRYPMGVVPMLDPPFRHGKKVATQDPE